MRALCYINEYTTCMSAGVEIQLSSIWLLFAPAFYDIGCPKKYNRKIVLFAPCLYKNRLRLFPNVAIFKRQYTTSINIIAISWNS